MNRCKEFIDKLSEYIDNELPHAESAAIKGHIESCKSCQDEFKALQAAKYILKSLPQKTASDEVRERILDRVLESKKYKVYRLLPAYFKRKEIAYRWMALAASILLVIFIGISDTNSSPVKVYLIEHQKCMLEGHRDYLCKTEHELNQKIENTMGIKPFIPSYFPEGFKFIKGDVCKIKGLTVAHLIMGKGDKILSYFQTKGEVAIHEMGKTGKFENLNYAHWQKNGVYCIVVGDIDEKEMLKIASSQSHPILSPVGRGER